MNITHILADGTKVASIEGKVITQTDFPSLYEALRDFSANRNAASEL